jgi:hypothetical protein
MIPGDTVVIDGEMSLLSEIDGDIDLIIPIDGEMGVITKVTEYDVPSYTGQVVVNPKFEPVILQTAGKVMNQNVTVNAIEVQEMSNTSGGLTVYIGGI